MEIIPDEIYVNIQLTEYQKKGNPKKDIEAIKSQFLESCKTTGIADSLISIASYSGYNNYYGWKKNRKKEQAKIFFKNGCNSEFLFLKGRTRPFVEQNLINRKFDG